MALASYTDLIAAVPNVMARSGDTELVAFMPTAVSLCEAKINRALRVGRMETVATGASSSGTVALPSDFLGLRLVEAQPYGALSPVSLDWGSEHYPSGEGGIPRYYAIDGTNLVTYPSYDGDLTLIYYAAVPGLEANSTNWLMTLYPDVYLYGTLVEACTFALDPDKAAFWADRFQRALADVQSTDTSERFGRSIARPKGPTP